MLMQEFDAGMKTSFKHTQVYLEPCQASMIEICENS